MLPPIVQLVCRGATATAEVAVTPRALKRGLRGRKSLTKDSGMLFVFPRVGLYPFWMEDTTIPLTVAWLRMDWTVIGMTDLTPGSVKLNWPPSPVAMALEMPRGWFDRHGIQVGDILSLRM